MPWPRFQGQNVVFWSAILVKTPWFSLTNGSQVSLYAGQRSFSSPELTLNALLPAGATYIA